MLIARETLEELYSKERLSQRAVARKLNVGHTTVRRYLGIYGIPTLERDVFDWNEDTAYIVGALLGDGCAYTSYSNTSPLIYRVDLAVSNERFARRIFNAALRIGLRSHWYKPQVVTNSVETYTRYKVGFLSKRLYQLISDLKLEPLKLLDLIKDTNEALFFVAGFYDAEGYYCNKSSRWYYLQMSNTNVPLLLAINLVLKKIDYDFRLRLVRKGEEKRKPLYRLVSTRRSVINSFLQETNEIRAKQEVIYA